MEVAAFPTLDHDVLDSYPAGHGGRIQPWRRNSAMEAEFSHGGGIQPWRRNSAMEAEFSHGGGIQPWRWNSAMEAEFSSWLYGTSLHRAFHYDQSARYDLNNVERDVKHQIIIYKIYITVIIPQ